ncbi:hypothetical protein F2P79_025178 [Pimephales promelas]|nr:hypothetical protein F2P79_025178 [Pimephales promelas]
MTQKALQVQQHNLEALKTELSLHDDIVHQWVSDVQQWAEDSNKRRHTLRLRRSEEKKKLAAAVEQYNSIVDPSQQAWLKSAPFVTKRKVFDKVMAVRRLQEEGGLICKEMKQHYTVLTHKLSKFEALINEISSKSLFSTLCDTARKGLLCFVRKKHYELRHLMQLVKASYVNIFSQQDLISEEEKLEQEDEMGRGRVLRK